MKPRLSSTVSQTNSAAISRQPTPHACCVCPDSPTENSQRNSSSKRARKATQSTRSAISRLMKIRPKRLADYRGDEKHGNYARLTVEKAQLELQRTPSLQPEREAFSGLADKADRHQ